MTIKEAKQQIKYALTAYLSRDELGNYEIPAAKQRPVFLIGPPGIGKTAIMEQIAQELGILLVSYSMTHHTRQSALGLPYIADKMYGGNPYKVSEYTMSEIIASVYDAMEDTGLKEGILFLDEINCVSETLTPSMLQFLQFKTFGRHALPQGWLVVTAGNPPEYNRSVREFDIVTMDRLKRINVEPDFEVWKEYAWQQEIHPAVLSYLEIKKNNFCHVQTGVNGKSFATPRGWEDLSRMIRLCEKKGLPVNRSLTEQYLQDPKINADFAAYYDLFRKYQTDYQIEAILSGRADAAVKAKAKNARFDEKTALLGLILDAISTDCSQAAEKEEVLTTVLSCLKNIRQSQPPIKVPPAAAEKLPVKEALLQEVSRLQEAASVREKSGAFSVSARRTGQLACAFLSGCAQDCPDFDACKEAVRKQTEELNVFALRTVNRLENAFTFLEEVYAQGQEMLLFVTELTVNEMTARLISHYGCEKYHQHSKDLMFHERGREIETRMNQLGM